ncbi:HIT domain-containing protein [Fannyhessea vaginae]|uniref:HIT domain-containing protein n=1 Tax=Fannyhessea vaginae TaxID=82135 RepID=UPI003A800737
MKTVDDCIFCKIIEGKIPSEFVYEDDLVCAFKDLNPLAPVHILIVPKHHYDDILDDVDADTLSALVHAAREIAAHYKLEHGLRLVTNKGDDAGQSVHHLHIHLLGAAPLSNLFGKA